MDTTTDTMGSPRAREPTNLRDLEAKLDEIAFHSDGPLDVPCKLSRHMPASN